MSGDPIDIEFEVKSEEEETYVRDDQQSMEEDGITGTFIEEDTPTEISTGGSLTLNPFLHPYCSLGMSLMLELYVSSTPTSGV